MVLLQVQKFRTGLSYFKYRKRFEAKREILFNTNFYFWELRGENCWGVLPFPLDLEQS